MFVILAKNLVTGELMYRKHPMLETDEPRVAVVEGFTTREAAEASIEPIDGLEQVVVELDEGEHIGNLDMTKFFH